MDTLLAAAARVPELTLVVVGDGPERGRLEAEAARLGIANRVSFRGESREVAELLRASDAFLLSSHGEGMSNALLEAMACGLPCLASRSVGGAAELLGEGRGGLLADGDVAAWAAAIQGLVDEPGAATADRDGRRRRSSPRSCRSTRRPTGSRGPTRSIAGRSAPASTA